MSLEGLSSSAILKCEARYPMRKKTDLRWTSASICTLSALWYEKDGNEGLIRSHLLWKCQNVVVEEQRQGCCGRILFLYQRAVLQNVVYQRTLVPSLNEERCLWVRTKRQTKIDTNNCQPAVVRMGPKTEGGIVSMVPTLCENGIESSAFVLMSYLYLRPDKCNNKSIFSMPRRRGDWQLTAISSHHVHPLVRSFRNDWFRVQTVAIESCSEKNRQNNWSGTNHVLDNPIQRKCWPFLWASAHRE